jgi:hypothetical protein
VLYLSYAGRFGLRELLVKAAFGYATLDRVDWLIILAGAAALAVWLSTRDDHQGRSVGRLGFLLLGGSCAVIVAGAIMLTLAGDEYFQRATVDLAGLSVLWAGFLAFIAIHYRAPLVGVFGAALAAVAHGLAEWELTIMLVDLYVLEFRRGSQQGLAVTILAIGFLIFSVSCAYLAWQARESSPT